MGNHDDLDDLEGGTAMQTDMNQMPWISEYHEVLCSGNACPFAAICWALRACEQTAAPADTSSRVHCKQRLQSCLLMLLPSP